MIEFTLKSRAVIMAAIIGALLAGCSTISSINPFDNGKSELEEIASDPARISILALDDNLEVTGTMLPSEIVLPQAYINPDWAQTGGYPTHAPQHTDAPGSLSRVWATGIGKGSFRKGRVVASPVVAGGRLYAVDADNRIVALDANTGKQFWRYEIEVAKIGKTREGGANIIERFRDPLSFRDTGGSDKEAIGGGVAVADGRVYVSSGYGLVLALDAMTGTEIWRTETRTPVHSAPAIEDGRLFAISDDNELFALDTQTGEVLWTYQAIIETARLMTAPSPAVIDDVVIAPFSSGEIVALRVQNGSVLWQDALDTSGNLTPLASLNDIGSGPVVADGYVFAAAQSGSLGAFDLRTGQRIWSQPAGSIGFPLVVGDFIFTVTTEGELTALSKTDGTVIWITQLEAFKNPKKRKKKIAWAGPIIAGGRLVLMNSDGRAIEVSPNDGTIIREFKTGGEVYVAPIIAGGMIYYITDNAKIHALR